MRYDILIVGAGLFGATYARLATDAGKRCLVIDRRPYPGGNVRCFETEGINVHQYGAHIFHTSDSKVWEFVNRFVRFNRFTNSPIAVAPDGQIYNLPFNMNTFSRMWGVSTPQEALECLTRERAQAVERMKADGASEPRNLEEQALALVGKDIYTQLVKGYTEKQWGRPCRELPAFIIRRLPVRLTYDNNYFNDLYQGIPEGGYNRLIDALLEGSELMTDTDFFADREKWEAVAEKTVFTGRIDQYYGYRFGELEYRTLRFETELLDTPNYQGNAAVNYTSSEVPFTRIIEHKHFETFGDAVYNNPHTVITREYPAEYKPGDEPFYPVNDSRNQVVYNRYRMLAEQEKNVLFGGRLAEYRYYDMAPVISRAMELFEKDNK